MIRLLKKLTYKKVFSAYEKPFGHKLSRLSYSVYKKVRYFISKWYPLKEHEKFHFDNTSSLDRDSTDILDGIDKETLIKVEGKIDLKYLDLFDYLPKEDISMFKKNLKDYVKKNNIPKFSPYFSAEDDIRIDNIARFSDGLEFTRLNSIKIVGNQFLEDYASNLSVSIHNLSTSFLVVKYRFYISDKFNDELNNIFKKKFSPFTDISRRFDIPWYKPWRFGKAFLSGNDARYEEIYFKTNELKWNVYKEIKKAFGMNFSLLQYFPPSFLTFRTNIPINKEMIESDFWRSITKDYYPDFSKEMNLYVSWAETIGKYEGSNISAYCGGNSQDKSYLPEIAENRISDTYGVYLVANTMRRCAIRDMESWNKTISKAIMKSNPQKLLKVRNKIALESYHVYRFLDEFSGETLDNSDTDLLTNSFIKSGTLTSNSFEGIETSTKETKKQIDKLLELLNNSIEYRVSQSNRRLELLMALITIFSLLVAIVALTDFKIDLKTIIFEIKNLIN